MENIIFLQTFWHSYKIACEGLFQVFFFEFWHPLLKLVQPHQTYVLKPKLFTLTSFFTIILIAWKSFRNKIIQNFSFYKNKQKGTFLTLFIILERTLPIVSYDVITF